MLARLDLLWAVARERLESCSNLFPNGLKIAIAVLATLILAAVSATNSDIRYFAEISGPQQFALVKVYSQPAQVRYAAPGYLQTPSGLVTGVFIPVGELEQIVITAPEGGSVVRVAALRRSLFNRSTAVDYSPYPRQSVTVDVKSIVWQTQPSLQWLFAFAFVFSGVYAVSGFRKLFSATRRIQVLFSAAAVCSVCIPMLFLSRYNHGPDEYMHFGSMFWYTAHVRPQLMQDPGYLNAIWHQSYVVGVSGDLPYLVTARLYDLVDQFFVVHPHVGLRLAQFLCFVTLVGLCAAVATPTAAIAMIAGIILVPQASYLLTYINGDILSYAFGFIALALVQYTRHHLAATLIVALFLVANVKSNYVVLFAFVGYALRRRLRCDGKAVKVIALWVSVAFPIIFYRRLINWWDQWANASTYIQDSYSRLVAAGPSGNPAFEYVKSVMERQIGTRSYLWELLIDARWYSLTAESFFGRFGYMNHKVSWPIIALSASLVAGMILSLRRSARRMLTVAAAFLLALLASLYYSVTVGSQAQGRYLFPALAVLMIVAAPLLRAWQGRIALGACATLAAITEFALSVP